MTAHVALMEQTVAAALGHVDAGGLPFVGVVVSATGLVSAPGYNQVLQTGDPTAHAEIVAMRNFAAQHPDHDVLTGAILLASGEPCPLCYGYAASRGVGRVLYAVDATTAADWGFDYRGPLNGAAARLAEQANQIPVANSLGPFRHYRAQHAHRR